jgi:hypothetical protein
MVGVSATPTDVPLFVCNVSVSATAAVLRGIGRIDLHQDYAEQSRFVSGDDLAAEQACRTRAIALRPRYGALEGERPGFGSRRIEDENR